MPELTLELSDENATQALGRALALTLGHSSPPPALLLTGTLGAGKTTLVRGLVACLPGAEQAEVASPSFNVLNLYPTTPPVAHFDLYRLEDDMPGCGPGEEFFELAEDRRTWCVVEWAERLAPADRPPGAVSLTLTRDQYRENTGRRAQIEASEEAILVRIESTFNETRGNP